MSVIIIGGGKLVQFTDDNIFVASASFAPEPGTMTTLDTPVTVYSCKHISGNICLSIDATTGEGEISGHGLGLIVARLSDKTGLRGVAVTVVSIGEVIEQPYSGSIDVTVP